MKHDETAYLQHMLDAIAKIESYLEGVDEAAFKGNSLVQDGVIRQMEIIGEAVKGLSTRLRNQYSHIPWSDMAGMRDKLIHHYFGVDVERVWLTAKQDFPSLKEEISKVLEKIF